MIQLRHLLIAVSIVAMIAAQPTLAAEPVGSIVQAIEEGRAADIDALLAAKADVNVPDDAGVTALALAVSMSDEILAQKLLKAGAKPDLPDAMGVTPLFVAVEADSPALVNLLLEHRASPNRVRQDGETPLLLAVRDRSPAIVKALLDHRANPNVADRRFGQTPLMRAVGRPEVVRMLLARGARVQAVTRSWEVTSVNYLPETGTLGVTGIPWNNDGTFKVKMGGYTPLLFAAQNGDRESVAMLLAAGADVNERAYDGTTALLAALYGWRATTEREPGLLARAATVRDALVFHSDYELANFLLDRGAAVNVTNGSGFTPLHAVLVSIVERSPMARQADRDPQEKPAESVQTPEQIAAARTLITRLLKSGADPNSGTTNPTAGPVGYVRLNPAPAGSTPLHVAARIDDVSLTRELIASGGDVNRIRKDGQSPFTIAVQRDRLDLVKAMVAGGANLTRLYDPSDLIPDPVESKAEARRKQTALHLAASAAAVRVVEYLASTGVPLDAVNDRGETAAALADAMERFFLARAMEGYNAAGAEKSKRPLPVRSTSLTDAFRRASATAAAQPPAARPAQAAQIER